MADEQTRIHVDLTTLQAADLIAEHHACEVEVVLLAAAIVLFVRYSGQEQLYVRWRTEHLHSHPVNLSGATTGLDVMNRVLAAAAGPDQVTSDDTNLPIIALSPRQEDGDPSVCFDGELPSAVSPSAAAGHYRTLLAGLVKDPYAPLAQIPTLTAPEQGDLAKWNNTTADVGIRMRLEELFLAQARNCPEATALITSGGDLTYGEMEGLSRTLAVHLVEKGAGSHSLVAVLAHRGWEQVVAVLAVLRAGAAYVPIDPEWPTTRIRHVLERSQCSLIVARHDIARDLAATKDWPQDVEPVGVPVIADSTSAPVTSGSLDDLAYVIFTSGSTGAPKGVATSHASAVNTVLDINTRFAVRATDRVLALSALTFDLSVYDIFGTLAAGAAIVCPDRNAARDPAQWIALTKSARVTVWNSVPALLGAAADTAERRGGDLSSLRLAMLSGDWIPVALPTRVGVLAPDVLVVGLGGATEAAIWSIAYPITGVDPDWDSIPYGRPLANQTFHVFDLHLQPVPVGVPGELYIGGVGVALGYWRDPERTAASFIRHPETRERLYRTGDFGRRRSDGVIEFLGRRDQQVKIRGFRIELEEIQTAMRRLSGVRDAAVIAPTLRGDDAPTLIAYVVPERTPTVAERAEFDRVAEWKNLFDSTYTSYGHPSPEADPDLAGWVSSYTGEPIPADDMRQWVDCAVGHVLRGRPQRILEIGCGTGLILLRAAPHCTAYHGTDPSAAALEHIRNRLDETPLPQVTLHQQAAHELSAFPDGSVDTVVLNSVIQYFPSVDYLLAVLDEASRVLSPHGRIFIGDVRDLRLLSAFHASVALHTAEQSMTVATLKKLIADRVAEETELVVDPALFAALRWRLPRLGVVETRIKDGEYRNELSQFRYDVILHLDKDAVAQPDDVDQRPKPKASDWDSYTNRPLRQTVFRNQARRWRQQLEDTLPPYLVPSIFVPIDSIPLTSNGKVDKAGLQVPDIGATTRPYAPPVTPEQSVLAGLWQEHLNVSRVGINDNFFELGGNSLRGMSIVAALADLGYTLSPEEFFLSPTVAEQAIALTTRVTRSDNPNEDSRPPRIRLVPAQEAMLSHYLADPAAGTYVVQSQYSLHGRLDSVAFTSAWRDMHNRHDLLRASIGWNESGQPEFHIAATTDPVIERVDLSSLSRRGQRDETASFLGRDRATGFDLTHGPLVRITLFRLDDRLHELVLTFHHIILDGWSLSLLETEFATSYAARLTGTPAEPAPVCQFDRYSKWWHSQDHEAAAAFWRRALADVTDPTRLPGVATDQPGDIARIDVPFTDTTIAALDRLCCGHQVTLTSVLHGAWALLLSRYSSAERVIFGVTSAGRPSELSGVQTGLGSFVATTPLPVTVPQNAAIADWLAELQTLRLQCQRFAYASPTDIQRASPLPPGVALFDTAVITDNHPANKPGWESGELSARHRSTITRTHWPLTVFAETTGKPHVTLQYDEAQVGEKMPARMARQLGTLLAEIAANPSQPVGHLNVLSRSEMLPLLGAQHEAPTTPVDLLIAEQARRSPGAIAVETHNECLTYCDLARRVDLLSARLRALGVGSGSLVAVCLNRRADLVTALVAVLASGAGYVPLDPSYPEARLRFMTENSGASIILSDKATEPHIPANASVQVLDIDADADQRADISEPADRTMDDTAYVIYTSGSSGVPKGVQVTHRALANLMTSMAAEPGIGKNDRLLAVTTVSFDIAALELFLPLVTGATVVMATAEDTRDGTALAALIRDRRITIMQATPTMWRIMIDAGWRGAPELRCLSGGETLSADLASDLQVRVGSLWNMYGPTETTIWSALRRVAAGFSSIPIGRPIANTRIFLLDQRLRSVPQGATGELYIGGRGLAAGYWRDQDQTAATFIHHPGTGERLYRTGDLGRCREDGAIEFQGRADQQVKIHGFRVEPTEIETALRHHGSVRDCAAALRENKLVAYVVPVREQPTIRSMRTFLGALLPRYMLPTQWVFLSRLPQTANGKLDRTALPSPRGPAAAETLYVPPRTDVERILANVWAAIFTLDRVGVEDNFFDLGGDSITALQVVIQAGRAGVRLTSQDLFTHQTIARLADVARKGGPTDPDITAFSTVNAPPRDAGHTPSDFPLAGLTQSQLDDVITALNRPKGSPHA